VTTTPTDQPTGKMLNIFVTIVANGRCSVDVLSMILVGALWGCTNPYLRKGSISDTIDARRKNPDAVVPGGEKFPTTRTTMTTSTTPSTSFNLRSSLQSFLHLQVWLPYALNQSGSIVFYILLANSNLSTAVPICNAFALIFTFWTSWYLGESLQKPVQTILGTVLILIGVTICVFSSEKQEELQQ
jgi:hypothetical protein